MFTGIITDIGTVLAATAHGAGLKRCASPAPIRSRHRAGRLHRLLRRLPDGGRHRARGRQGWFEVDAAAETLRLTSVAAGSRHAHQSRTGAEDRR
jgi:riboflavin synthase alpha subunit